MMKRRAFTLIEILIVVAILAILAMISIPHFLNAQVRAKVAQTQSDLRAVVSALEMYALDNGNFPRPDGGITGWPGGWFSGPSWFLTTPVAYIAVIPTDVFTRGSGWHDEWWDRPGPLPVGYASASGGHMRAYYGGGRFADFSYVYWVWSVGPDERFNLYGMPEYSVSNGVISDGDIFACNARGRGSQEGVPRFPLP